MAGAGLGAGWGDCKGVWDFPCGRGVGGDSKGGYPVGEDTDVESDVGVDSTDEPRW